jgi:hypothetical protein
MTIHALTTISNTEAVRLTPNGTHSGMDITLQNVNDSGYIYIGSEDVSSLDYGFRIMPNHSISLELTGSNSLYAISSASNMKLAILKTGLENGS